MTTKVHALSAVISTQTRFMPTFAHMLCDDIDDSKFADRMNTTINHPAFVLGHISYYAGVCIEMLGASVVFDEGEAELYRGGVECSDDATKYPDKDSCLEHFESRCNEAAAFIESCEPDVLERSAKDTPFAERFATLGQVASFMLMGHPSFHLGQISGWRRIAGMGSAT